MKHSFLGFEFNPIVSSEGKNLSDFLARFPQPLAGYTFAALAAWDPFYKYGLAFAGPESLLISFVLDADSRRHLIQPVGPMSPEIQNQILAEGAKLPYPLKIVGACCRFLMEYPDFADRFDVTEDRSVSNYVYLAKDLANLAGRRYAKKRNLISQAAGLYSWEVKPFNARDIASCFTVLNAIAEEEQPEPMGLYQREVDALGYTLHHFDELVQRGLLITIAGRPVAFSIHETINPNTVATHFERALRSYKGLHQVINCEAAKIIAAQGFEFINREEDAGNPGLRDAKLSYHPIEIVPAYEMTFKGV
jgi:uncharacterized protein